MSKRRRGDLVRLTAEEACNRVRAHDPETYVHVKDVVQKWLGSCVIEALQTGQLKGFWIGSDPHDYEHAMLRTEDLLEWMAETGHGLRKH